MGEIEIVNLIVEWDYNKAELNWKKHGIRFRVAARIFLDENKFEDYDELHSDEEDRWKVVGKVRDVLVVIYTERGEKYRIISARYATKEEEDEYYGQYPYL
ncbi:MAG: BrnT family toxin [Selenomonadaceae bacterium]|nr:BrnT family toxin [Selenomonadaceae bacterium]